MRSIRPMLFLASMVVSHAAVAVAAEMEEDAADEMRKARLMAKPWLMRSLQIGGVNLYFSPATLIAALLFAVQIIYSFILTSQWCEASHILIKDTSPKTKKAMEAMVKDIGSNYRKFGDLASKYSQCPSKVKNGELGRFPQGAMAPAFDKMCFDPNSKENVTLGPVQTQFGFHLIFIRKRKL